MLNGTHRSLLTGTDNDESWDDFRGYTPGTKLPAWMKIGAEKELATIGSGGTKEEVSAILSLAADDEFTTEDLSGKIRLAYAGELEKHSFTHGDVSVHIPSDPDFGMGELNLSMSASKRQELLEKLERLKEKA